MRVGLVVSLAMWVGIALTLSHCGFSRGWQVSFGAHPVSQIDNKQGLIEHDYEGAPVLGKDVNRW